MKFNLLNFAVISLMAIVLQSCVDPSKYGAIRTHGDSDSFMFMVSEEFSEKNRNSSPDSDNPKLTKAQASLLSSLLSEKNICVDKSYIITSKQEKIYDVTYASLIEENYNTKSVTPLTFYGRCK